MGECNDTLMSTIPLDVAGHTPDNGQRKSVRSFHVTERVIRNGHLIHRADVWITWEEAASLGLCEMPTPLPSVTPPPIVETANDESVEVEIVDEDDVDEEMEQRVDPSVLAAVRRRTRTNHGAKLGGVA
jgi:hypothetical protein